MDEVWMRSGHLDGLSHICRFNNHHAAQNLRDFCRWRIDDINSVIAFGESLTAHRV